MGTAKRIKPTDQKGYGTEERGRAVASLGLLSKVRANGNKLFLLLRRKRKKTKLKFLLTFKLVCC